MRVRTRRKLASKVVLEAGISLIIQILYNLLYLIAEHELIVPLVLLGLFANRIRLIEASAHRAQRH
jgi:hypothetical protein